MSSNIIVDLYRLLMTSAGMVASEEGHVSTQLSSRVEKNPTLVKGKRLVLPTQIQLSGASAESSVVFHPLRENTLRGESDVMAVFRNHVSTRMNFSLAYLAASLMKLTVETDKHPRLTPEQSQFLSIVKNADNKTLETLEEILSKVMMGDAEHSFVHLYMKKGGVMAGHKHSRVCNVSFPIYEQLVKEPEKGKGTIILGVKLRKVDRESLLGLFKYILPDINTVQAYWGASNSEVAPTLDALMASVTKIGDRINTVAALFSEYIDEVDEITYDLDYVPIFKDLESIRTQINFIPPQLGNEGSVAQTAIHGTAPSITVDDAPVIRSAEPRSMGYQAPTDTSVQIAQAQANVAPTPVAAPAPAPWVAVAAPAPVAQAPVLQPWQQQVAPVYGGYPVHQQQPMQPQPAPRLVKTANGIDFMSVIQSNPAMAAQAANLSGFYQQQQQYGGGYPQQQSRQPRWAAAPTYAPGQTPGVYYGGGGI